MAISRGSKVFLGVFVVVLLVVGGGLWYVNHLLGGSPGPGDPVSIEVHEGATAGAIGDLLVEEGVVRSSLAFRLVARSRSLDSQLQAGRYELETGMGVDEAIDALLAGPLEPETYRVTVQEGLTVSQTLDRLAEQTPHARADFEAVLEADELEVPSWVPALSELGPEVRSRYEGVLFPETYEFKADAPPRRILQRMVDQLGRVDAGIDEADVQALAELGLGRYQALILASLVERETRVDEERPKVAGVLLNRLEEGMLLQVDATVLYALGKAGEGKNRVLKEDLEVDSPYNTYEHPGLPPTPIAGVGRASIEAVYQAEDVPFRYYVLAPECDGTHRFAETLQEHNRNVAAFRESPCQQTGTG